MLRHLDNNTPFALKDDEILLDAMDKIAVSGRIVEFLKDGVLQSQNSKHIQMQGNLTETMNMGSYGGFQPPSLQKQLLCQTLVFPLVLTQI